MTQAPKQGWANLICQHCGKTYAVVASRQHRSRFCSKECMDLAATRGEVHACPICGSSFYVPRWKVLQGAGRFCSRQCYGKSIRDQVEAECIQCHHTYVVKRSKEGATQFCSRECQAAWQSANWQGEDSPRWGGEERTCEWCGARYYIGKWKADHNLSRFCSRECYGHWRSRELRGEKSNRWKGGRAGYYGPNWKQQRKRARLRDDRACQRCGTRECGLDQALSVHHIRPFREFGYIPGENTRYLAANRLDNLTSLCQSCHMIVEHAVEQPTD